MHSRWFVAGPCYPALIFFLGMIIHGKAKFVVAPFSSEQELEAVVQQNADLIFGPDSIYLPRSLIRTSEGSGTVPDGFVVDIAAGRWFIIEAELAAHSVWNHIAPQVAKQIIAASQPASRRALIELIVNRVKDNTKLKDRFDDNGIHEIDIRRFLEDIFAGKPIIGIPIDDVGNDLREWAQTLKVEVRLWVVRKLVEFEDPATVMYEIPEEYKPTLDTSPEVVEGADAYHYYDVTVADLIKSSLLHPQATLQLTYGPRGREKKQYPASVLPDGSIEVLGKRFSAPSYAALACLQDAGSDRETVNGWMMWRNVSGETLADLRAKFLTRKQPV